MILDSSALVAVVLGEPDALRISALLEGADRLGVGAPTLAETAVVLRSRLGDAGRVALDALLDVADIDIEPFGEMHWQVADTAYSRFGRGRHPAALTFGDCLTYATARVAGRPLVCIGDDFRRTDLPLVEL